MLLPLGARTCSYSTNTTTIMMMLVGGAILCGHVHGMAQAIASANSSTAASLLEALSTVAYEFVVLLTFFLSWVAWRAASKKRSETSFSTDKLGESYGSAARRAQHKDPHGSGLRHRGGGTNEWREERERVQSASRASDSQRVDAERIAARIMAMSTDQYTKALRMYRDLVRTKKDREIKDERFYFALVQASIRVGNTDVAGQLLRAMKRNDVPRSLPFFQSVLKLFASKHHFAQCLMVYEHFKEELPLDKTVLSCIAFAATESSDTDTAMEVFEKMRSGKAQCELSGKDYVNLFRIFAKRGDSNGAIELLRSLVGTEIPLDTVLVNIVLSACISAGEIPRARSILNEAKTGAFGGVPVDVVSFNTVMKGYATGGKIDTCFELIAEMQEHAVVPDDITYGILLDACIADNDLNKANEVLDKLIKSGVSLNTVLYTTFMKGFVRANMLDRAMSLYETMKANAKQKDQNGGAGEQPPAAKPDLITYSILIKAHCDKRNMEVALNLLEDMLQSGYQPDDIVLNHLLEGCCHVGNADLGVHLFTDMVASGKIKPSVYTLATMVKLYGKCGRCDDAVNLVGKMEEQFGLKPSVVIFTCLMSGCIRNKRFDHAFNVFEQSKKAGIQPDKMTYQTLVDGCRQAANWEKAIELVSEAFANKADLTPEFLNSTLAAMISKCEDPLISKSLFNIMMKQKVPCTVPSATRRFGTTS